MVKSLKERGGKYGMAKYKAFTSLEHRDWVTSRELVLLAGLKYHSISRLLPRWLAWDYVERQMTYKFGEGTYKYRLLARGKGWLEVARRDLPAASQFDDELRSWQRYIVPLIPELMAGKFKNVLEVLNTSNIKQKE